MRSAAATLTLCLALGTAVHAGTVYRDAAWHFQIDVADGWTAKPLPQEGDSFRLLVEPSKSPGGREVCLVYVEGDEETRDASQAELDRQVRNGTFGPAEPRFIDEDRMGDVAQDKVVDLNGHAARLIEIANKAGDSSKRWIYQLRFMAPGRAFRVYCTAVDQHYAILRPIFMRMAHSVRLID